MGLLLQFIFKYKYKKQIFVLKNFFEKISNFMLSYKIDLPSVEEINFIDNINYIKFQDAIF